jgi:hypothetical protein
MVTVETVSIVFTGLSVSLAAFYYISTLRNAQKSRELTIKAQEQALETRQAQLFMQIHSRITHPEFVQLFFEIFDWEYDDYEDYVEKYGSDVINRAKSAAIANYFEGVGVLVERGLIDASYVDDLMSGGLMRYWEKVEPFVTEDRIRLNWPQSLEYVEYLYNRVKEIYDRQHPELKT